MKIGLKTAVTVLGIGVILGATSTARADFFQRIVRSNKTDVRSNRMIVNKTVGRILVEAASALGAMSDGVVQPADELLTTANISVRFAEINDVDESPSMNGALREVDQWLCVLLFKDAKTDNVPQATQCENDCFTRVRDEWIAGADARACYQVEGCWDEDNAGDAENDIQRCRRPRHFWVKDPETTTLADITHAYLLAHDTDGDDFDFFIRGIEISTDRTQAHVAGSVSGEVPHQFLLMDLGDVIWTERD